MSVLVVGRGFLGSAIVRALGARGRLVGHARIADPALLHGVRTVIWAGRHPALGTPHWRLEEDLELFCARCAAERGIAFVSLGTRKVYLPSRAPLRETDPLGPRDRYGEQKLALERALREIPELRLTCLRLANIFGFERDAQRQSFMTRLLSTLAREGEVRLDVSPFTERDFVPVEEAAQWIAALALDPPQGVINLGSGIGMPLGRLALRVIEGYGRGRLVVEDPRERDGFVLDVTRLRRLLPHARLEVEQIKRAAFAIGRRLTQEST